MKIILSQEQLNFFYGESLISLELAEVIIKNGLEPLYEPKITSLHKCAQIKKIKKKRLVKLVLLQDHKMSEVLYDTRNGAIYNIILGETKRKYRVGRIV